LIENNRFLMNLPMNVGGGGRDRCTRGEARVGGTELKKDNMKRGRKHPMWNDDVTHRWNAQSECGIVARKEGWKRQARKEQAWQEWVEEKGASPEWEVRGKTRVVVADRDGFDRQGLPLGAGRRRLHQLHPPPNFIGLSRTIFP
jgi:hypothetical protein